MDTKIGVFVNLVEIKLANASQKFCLLKVEEERSSSENKEVRGLCEI